MSSRSQKKIESVEFSERLAEVCQTRQPAMVARLLNVSYQAAKNYLSGRLPEASVLMRISEQTGCSIHWLLTGQGEIFVKRAVLHEDTPPLTRQMEAFVRRICVEVINEVLDKEQAQPKVVVLQSANLMSEKAQEQDPVALPDERSQ